LVINFMNASLSFQSNPNLKKMKSSTAVVFLLALVNMLQVKVSGGAAAAIVTQRLYLWEETMFEKETNSGGVGGKN
jgi:hypothetical protein